MLGAFLHPAKAPGSDGREKAKSITSPPSRYLDRRFAQASTITVSRDHVGNGEGRSRPGDSRFQISVSGGLVPISTRAALILLLEQPLSHLFTLGAFSGSGFATTFRLPSAGGCLRCRCYHLSLLPHEQESDSQRWLSQVLARLATCFMLAGSSAVIVLCEIQ